MGKEFIQYENNSNVYICKFCKTHISCKFKVLSKTFKGKCGRCFLTTKLINITLGPQEEKFLLTGIHLTKDVFCKTCSNYLGWTYIKAYEPAEKYKEGKFVLERNLVTKSDWVL